jgi:hypothetical protein
MNTVNFEDFYSNIIKKHIWILLITCGLLVGFQQKGFAVGLFAGGILSGIFFRVLYIQIKKVSSLQNILKKKVFALFFIKYIVSYFVFAGLLYLALKISFAVFWGMVLGILSIKIELLATAIFGNKKNKRIYKKQ